MEGNAQKADGGAFPSKRESRFSEPVLREEPGSEDLKKAAEAIKQEYKSLIQHLTHLHGAGVGSSTQVEERALSMFAPNMQLPPELKGLKEQERERKERLKELRDALRKRKEVEPAGLMDWFESDGGSFIEGRAAKMPKQEDNEQAMADGGISKVDDLDPAGTTVVDPVVDPKKDHKKHGEGLTEGGEMEGDRKPQVDKVVKAEELEPKDGGHRDRRSGDRRRSGENRHSRREDRRRSSHKEEQVSKDRNRGRDRDRERDREKGRKRHADHKRDRRSREGEQDRETREKPRKRDRPRSRDGRSRKRSSSREKREGREAMRQKRDGSLKKGSGSRTAAERASKAVEKSPSSPVKAQEAVDQMPGAVLPSAEVVDKQEAKTCQKDENDVPSPTARSSCEADPACEQAEVEAKLKELHDLEALIAGGGVLQWYQDKFGGCEAFSTGDKGERGPEKDKKQPEGTEVVNLVDDDEEVESTSGLKRLQRAAEKAIENEREELIDWLKSRDPNFPGNPGMGGSKEDSLKAPEVKKTVVIKRNSFFPVPRAKPKQENPDFAIVKPAVVPKIVFKENGLAESVRPAEGGNALESSSHIIHPLAATKPKNSASASMNAVPPSVPKQHTVVYQLPGVLNNPMFCMPNVRTLASALGPQGHRPLMDHQRPPSFGNPPQPSAPGGFPSGAPFPCVGANAGFHQSPGPPLGPPPLGIHVRGGPGVGGHPPNLPQVSNPPSLRPRMPVPPQGPPPGPPQGPPVHPPSMPPPPPRTPSGGFPAAESMGNHPIGPQAPVAPPHPPPPPMQQANAFRVPPPPIPDMSAQGPAYEIGKDEEETPTGSTHEQVPPPPPPLTSHPMYRPEILGRNMNMPSPQGPPPPQRAPHPGLQQSFPLGPLGFPGNPGGRFGPRGPPDHFRPPPSMQPPPPAFPRPHHM
ncbi:hypothetical protein BSKO_01263 [Bryopsis sp. KO-2023]|nr:hypothetical protein BSKO_01263 [Bryopsis sp. KO-2023]